MSLTAFGVNHPMAVKLWSRRLFYESLKATWFDKFVGTSSNSLVQILSDTQKGPGDKITFPLRMQLVGRGVSGDLTLEGNEEALSIYTDSVIIDQLRHAVRSAGKMSEQRVPFEVRDEAFAGLKDWWANRLDTSFFNVLGGNTVAGDIVYTGMQVPVAPDTNHRIVGDGTVSDDANITNTMKFSLSHIDKAVERAKTFDTSTAAGLVPIRPLRINGEDKYVIFIHPYQTYDLRTNTNTGQWLDIQKAAMQGGQVTNNPIYTGAVGEYNGVVIHESFRVPTGISNAGVAVSNTKRAIFCGAQAAVMAYGQDGGPNKMSWVEEKFDYQNQLGVAAGLIFGLKKTQFNNLDFGAITISTYAAQHA